MGDPSVPGTALRILRLLLAAGPTTAAALAPQVRRHPATVREALRRLSKHGLAMIVGTPPRQHGSSAPLPYIWDVGPAIREWHGDRITAQARPLEARRLPPQGTKGQG